MQDYDTVFAMIDEEPVKVGTLQQYQSQADELESLTEMTSKLLKQSNTVSKLETELRSLRDELEIKSIKLDELQMTAPDQLPIESAEERVHFL